METLIQPQTELERHALSDARFQRGAAWGEPRPGHPEGAVISHIVQVLENIAALSSDLDEAERLTLRFVALTHDTLKLEAEGPGAPPEPEGVNTHCELAADWVAELIGRATQREQLPYGAWLAIIPAIVRTHDEGFSAWLDLHRAGAAAASARIDQMLAQLAAPQCEVSLSDRVRLWWRFYRADSEIPGKSQEPVAWVEEQLRQRGALR